MFYHCIKQLCFLKGVEYNSRKLQRPFSRGGSKKRNSNNDNKWARKVGGLAHGHVNSTFYRSPFPNVWFFFEMEKLRKYVWPSKWAGNTDSNECLIRRPLWQLACQTRWFILRLPILRMPKPPYTFTTPRQPKQRLSQILRFSDSLVSQILGVSFWTWLSI